MESNKIEWSVYDVYFIGLTGSPSLIIVRCGENVGKSLTKTPS